MAEPWEPSMTDVGGRIPTRTRDQTTPGDDRLLGTFNDRTVPTAEQVTVLVPGAVAGIQQALTTIPASLYELARAAAAWRVAADVELAYPERDGDLDVYERLNTRAALALQELKDAAVDDGASTTALLPVWSMPDPVPWGDTYL